MSYRTATRPRTRLSHGHGSFVIVLATLIAAFSTYLASALDVSAMLTPEGAALRANAAPNTPVEIPREWVWRGRPPIDLESMYANREKPSQDWIRVHRVD